MSTETLRERLVRERLEGAGAPEPGIGRADRTGPLPLSWGQQQFCLLHSLAPGSPEYLVPMAFRLRGALDVSALAGAWADLVARHEILRTTYTMDEPDQVVRPVSAVDFGMVDATAVADREASVREVLARETDIPIDLAGEVPARARLVRYAATDHLLILVFHHIACDAMTHTVVVEELAELYNAQVEGRPHRLPPDPVQYADYAAWEQKQPVDLDYWRGQLADLAPLDLPTDRPRPAVRDWVGATVPVQVPPATAARLRGLGRAHGTTLYVVLLTAFQALLARYTGNRDIAVGTAVSGRGRPELERLVGYAYNTLVLRARWDGGGFADLLAANRDTVLDAFDHADAPFFRLATELRPERDPSVTPLFQVMLDLRAGAGPALAMRGVDAELVPHAEGVAKFDLTMHMKDGPGDALSGELEYATALFDESTATRIAGHYVRFLTQVADDPHVSLDLVEFLAPDERAALLGAAEPAPVARSVGEMVSGAPDAPAVIAGADRMTYAELAARANQYAHFLRERGVGPESTVGVLLRRRPDLVACLLGVWQAGAAYVPLDPAYPADRVDYMVANAGVHIVLTEQACAGTLPTGHRDKAVLVDSAADPIGRQPVTPVRHTPDLDALAYVMYTSGSTGRPKGVAVTHRGLANYLAWAVRRYSGPGGAPLFSSIAFDLGVPNLYAPLLTGQPVHLVPDDFDVDRLGELLSAGAPYGFVKLTPGHLDLLSQQLAPAQAAGFAGLVIAAGDEFPHRLVTRWAELGGPPLAAEYGPTEITVGNSAHFLNGENGEPATHLVPIGSPIPGTTMYVLDENMLLAPTGVVGEVYIGGVGVARGYVNQPGLTAEKFVPNPYGEPGSRLYRTGDLARVLADGSVDFAGRADHQVKVRGYRIELDEVEAALVADTRVHDAVVIVRDERLVAYVVAPGADPESLHALAAAALPPYMVPSAFVLLDTIPLTGNGKVDRRALPAPDRDAHAVRHGYVPPRTAAERQLAEVWSDVLGVDTPGVQDSFFDLGGDSISAVALVGRLRGLGFDVSVRDVFASRTIAALADQAARTGTAEPAPTTVAPFTLLTDADRAALPAGVVDAYPISVTQRGMLLEMLGGGSVNYYHNITAFRIMDDVPFSLDAFRAAVDLVVARHDVMRTAYDLVTYSEPVQLVLPDARMPIGLADLRHVDRDRQEEELRLHFEAERSTLFTLAEPPLMRMFVHLRDNESWWLSITECHPILEGWSYHSQLMELLRAYRRIRAGLEPERPEPVEARYADFVATELAALDSADDQDYWRGVITEHAKFTLPAGWADPTATEPERYHITIPIEDLDKRLRELAALAGASYKSVLHAAHLAVLSQLTPEESFFSGIVCDARPELPGFERVSGMYLNSAPFPHRKGARTWVELVRQVFDQEVELWPHRHYPMPAMPRLVEGGGGRLVDVLFHYLDFHQVDPTLVDVLACVDDSPNEFGLVVGTPIKGNLSIASDPTVVSRANADRLARMYRLVLEAMAADPAGDPQRPALPGVERMVGERVPVRPVAEIFAERVAATPDAVAVVAGEETVTYAELAARAGSIAAHLRDLEVGPESRVGVLLDRGIDLVAALLGVWQAGAAYVPLDPGHPADRLRAALAGTLLVLTEPAHAPVVADLRPVLVGDIPPASVAPLVVDPDTLAYVIHTSGSTGGPKGVEITHRGLANYLSWVVDTYVRGDGGAPVFSSIAFDLTVPNLFAPLLAGQPVHLLPQDVPLADLGRTLSARAPYSFVMLTPAHLEVLVDQLGPDRVAGLAGVLVAAGDALPAGLASRMSGKGLLRTEYGPTEVSVGVSGNVADGSLGRPIPNTAVHVMDAELRPVPVGVVGEVCVAGAGLARGYADDPRRTAERFVPDPYGPPGTRLYRTGDLARVSRDGRLEFAGRADRQVKLRGYRVELGDVEAALTALAAVRAAAVRLDGNRLVGYVVPAGAFEPDALRAALAKALPAYLVPAVLVEVAALPLTANGKVDHAALPAPPRAGGAPPASAAERILAGIWARLTGATGVTVDDTFLGVGGDSLMTMRLYAEAHRAGLAVSLPLLHRDATLREIAANATETR